MYKVQIQQCDRSRLALRYALLPVAPSVDRTSGAPTDRSAEARQCGKEGVATQFGIWRCDVYRELGNLIVLLTDDLERARKHWRTGRALVHPDERGVADWPGFDPVWFSR